MKKKIAFFDIDGVIYDGHSMFDQIHVQEKQDFLTKGTSLKLLLEAAKFKLKLRSYKQTADAMLNIHSLSFKNQEYKKIEKITFIYLKNHLDKIFPYFPKLIRILKRTHDICLVTNNFQFVSSAIGKLHNINLYLSSVAEVENGKFTGRVTQSLAGNKSIVSGLIRKYGREGSLAVGNSLNDAAMLERVEYPFLFEPDNVTKKIANQRNWQIVTRNNSFKKILQTVS